MVLFHSPEHTGEATPAVVICCSWPHTKHIPLWRRAVLGGQRATREWGKRAGTRGPFWTTSDKNADSDTRLGQGWSIWLLAKESTSVLSISGHRVGMFRPQWNGQKVGIQSWISVCFQKDAFVRHNLLWPFRVPHSPSPALGGISFWPGCFLGGMKVQFQTL